MRGGKEEILLDGRANIPPTDWTSDERILFTQSQGTAGSTDLTILDLNGDRQPSVYLGTPAFENEAVRSPDGKWVAYTSDETGQQEVYVRPFPPSGGKSQISTTGGANPLWRHDGRELLFLSGDRIMAAAVDLAAGFEFTPPVPPLSSSARVVRSSGSGRQFAVTRDGSRFLVNAREPRDMSMSLNVVMNWPSTLPR